MESRNILLVGGTGVLGSIIHRILKDRNQNLPLLIGSRNPNTLGQIEIDVCKPETFQNIITHQVTLVVMCTTDTDDNMLSFCINNQLDYLDVTRPNPHVTSTYEKVINKPIESRIVFASGWMGGVIPSLLKDFYSLEEVNAVEIFIYYSLKDKAGKNAADFMAENISIPFPIYKNNQTKMVRHFTGKEKYSFSFVSQQYGTTYFDIPDLYILNKIECISNVVAKITYNSGAANRVLAIAQSFNLFRLLSIGIRKKLFSSAGEGDITGFEILVEGKDKIKSKISVVHKAGQAELTAFSTSLHIEQMYNTSPKNGIYISHQLYESQEYIDKLKQDKQIRIEIK